MSVRIRNTYTQYAIRHTPSVCGLPSGFVLLLARVVYFYWLSVLLVIVEVLPTGYPKKVRVPV